MSRGLFSDSSDGDSAPARQCDPGWPQGHTASLCSLQPGVKFKVWGCLCALSASWAGEGADLLLQTPACAAHPAAPTAAALGRICLPLGVVSFGGDSWCSAHETQHQEAQTHLVHMLCNTASAKSCVRLSSTPYSSSCWLQPSHQIFAQCSHPQAAAKASICHGSTEG